MCLREKKSSSWSKNSCRGPTNTHVEMCLYIQLTLCLSYRLSFRNKEDIWCPSRSGDECNSLGQVELLGTCTSFDMAWTGLSAFLSALDQKCIWFHLCDKSCRLLLSRSLHSKKGQLNQQIPFKVALRLISRKRGETFEVVLFWGGCLPGVAITVVCLRPRHGCDRCQETKLIGHEVFYNEKRIEAGVSIHLTSLRIKESLWTQFILSLRGLRLMRMREREWIPDSKVKTLTAFFLFSFILRRKELTDSKWQ